MEDVPSVLHEMFKHGDERIAFSDRIERVNHRNFREKRVLILSHNALYILMAKGNECIRVIKLDDVDKISMSRRASDHLAIHHKTEEDLLFVSPKRTEVANMLGAE